VTQKSFSSQPGLTCTTASLVHNSKLPYINAITSEVFTQTYGKKGRSKRGKEVTAFVYKVPSHMRHLLKLTAKGERSKRGKEVTAFVYKVVTGTFALNARKGTIS